MITSNQLEYAAKQEYNTPENSTTTNPSKSSSTTSWSRLKDPRIVRVSRAFGGKDRHSKVCTIRGLRDRRVRLSVPTAIQLYDLQDRLGLNQPSKVVDWLLNAAKNEIDELPPLQIPQGSFITPSLLRNDHEHGLQFDNSIQENNQDSFVSSSSTNSFSHVPYNSFVRWDPSQNRHGENDHLNHMNFSLGTAGGSSHHQVLVYQNGGQGGGGGGGGGGTSSTTQSYFPSHIENNTNDSEMHFQDGSVLQLSNSSLTSTVESTTQHVKPFHFNL